MGKRKYVVEGESGSRKKHKKNKHKKRAKTRDDDGNRVAEAEPGMRPLTLKIKLGRKPSSAVESDEEGVETSSVGDSGMADGLLGGTDERVWPPSDPSFTEDAVEHDMEASEGEEEAWLVAMEKGQLDERGYIPRRPGAALTARQRAMMGSGDGPLMELPLGKANKEMTEEMMLKKTEKNRKRRQAAQRRKEKRKAETVRKLLEKQSKKKEESKPAHDEKSTVPCLHYVSSQHSASLSIPHGMQFPMTTQSKKEPSVQRLCSAEGCGSPRRYSDSATGVALCSFNCYKTLHQQSSHMQSIHS